MMIRMLKGPLAVGILSALMGCGDPVDTDLRLRVENLPQAQVPAGTLWPLAVPGDTPVEWLVSDATLASITDNGVLWARAPGDVVVIVRRQDDTAQATIRISEPREGKVVFLSDEGIHVIRADGEGETVVARGDEVCSFVGLDVSPAGDAIAATCSDRTAIYWMRLDGSSRREVASDYALDVAFAGADRLLYASGSYARTVDLSSDAIQTVWTEESPRDDGGRLVGIGGPVSPDGQRVFFSGTTEGFPYDERLGTLQAVDSLYVAELADIAGTRRAIAHDLARDPASGVPGLTARIMLFYRVSPSPRGDSLLVTHSLGVFLVDPDDAAARSSLFSNKGYAHLADFSPDGAWAVGVRTEFTEVDLGIVRVPIEHGEGGFVIQRQAVYGDPTWSR